MKIIKENFRHLFFYLGIVFLHNCGGDTDSSDDQLGVFKENLCKELQASKSLKEQLDIIEKSLGYKLLKTDSDNP